MESADIYRGRICISTGWGFSDGEFSPVADILVRMVIRPSPRHRHLSLLLMEKHDGTDIRTASSASRARDHFGLSSFCSPEHFPIAKWQSKYVPAVCFKTQGQVECVLVFGLCHRDPYIATWNPILIQIKYKGEVFLACENTRLTFVNLKKSIEFG